MRRFWAVPVIGFLLATAFLGYTVHEQEQLERKQQALYEEIREQQEEFEKLSEHYHQLYEENNTIEHEEQGYCGNMVTSVEYLGEDGERWKRSFEGSDSVKVTDMLRYLNYCEQICTCPAEYSVKTELGTNYEVNLTKGFARNEEEQTPLTKEQVATLLDVVGRLEEMDGGESIPQ